MRRGARPLFRQVENDVLRGLSNGARIMPCSPIPCCRGTKAVAILIAVGDMTRNVARIKFLLEQEFGGEEGLEEDDP